MGSNGKERNGLTRWTMWADWAPEENEVPPGQEGGTTHLWEESWDDDDTSEDFSKQLKWVFFGGCAVVWSGLLTVCAERSWRRSRGRSRVWGESREHWMAFGLHRSNENEIEALPMQKVEIKTWTLWRYKGSIEARLTEDSYLHEEEIISQPRPAIPCFPSFSESCSIPFSASEPLGANLSQIGAHLLTPWLFRQRTDARQLFAF